MLNGYEIAAESCRRAQARARSEEERQELEAKARAFDTVAGLTDADKCRLFDTGAFNFILQGYVRMLFDSWEEAEEEVKEAAENGIAGLLEEKTAAQALAYYMNL